MKTEGSDDEPIPRDGANPRLNPAKARRAAQDPQRPGERCRAPPGEYRPVVDREACEGKGDCVEVCPYGVFEVRPIEPGDFAALPLFARFKVWVHGKKSAYTPGASACRACGLCVVACPEQAISLARGRGGGG